jgi:hypothetical protein
MFFRIGSGLSDNFVEIKHHQNLYVNFVMSKVQSNLPSQIDFSFLSAPDLQSGACFEDAEMQLGESGHGGSSSSNKTVLHDHDVCVPFSSISPEAYALLAAAEAAAARRTVKRETRVMEIDASANVHGSTRQIVSDGGYDPERVLPSMAPPKRYFRTFWRSVSFRLLQRWAQTARPYCNPGASLVRQMA